MTMAMRQVKIDDLDGSEDGVRLVTFALDGKSYEIDLGAANREMLANALAPFIAAGRPTTSTPIAGRARTGKRRSKGGSEVRQWARANGLPVPDRGRIPKHVMDAYIVNNPPAPEHVEA
jgi:hypothetical protein